MSQRKGTLLMLPDDPFAMALAILHEIDAEPSAETRLLRPDEIAYAKGDRRDNSDAGRLRRSAWNLRREGNPVAGMLLDNLAELEDHGIEWLKLMHRKDGGYDA